MIAWAFLTIVSIAVFAWPTWLALIAAQVVTLFMGLEEMRWLPSEVLGLGVLWCVVRLLLESSL